VQSLEGTHQILHPTHLIEPVHARQVITERLYDTRHDCPHPPQEISGIAASALPRLPTRSTSTTSTEGTRLAGLN